MAGKSDYLENKLIDLIFRSGGGASFTSPTGLWVGLYTGAPTDAGGGTEVSTTGTNYTRASIGVGVGVWYSTNGTTSGASSGTNGQTSNVSAVNFGVPGATTWGTVTHFGIFDAVSAGNLLYWGALTNPKTVNSGDPAPSFPVSSLVITED